MAKKQTGMGANAFFKTETKPEAPIPTEINAAPEPVDKAERRSFNLKQSTLRLLDEVQIKTMRDGQKWTLSAIVEHGIALVAQEMGVEEPPV